jgi:hypothetical protein
MSVKVKSKLNHCKSVLLLDTLYYFYHQISIIGVNDRMIKILNRFIYDTLLASSPIVQLWMKARSRVF